MPPIALNTAVVMTGVVEDPERGLIRLDTPIDDKRTILSVQAQRYPINQRVELTFRVINENKKQLVRLLALMPSDRYKLVVVAEPPTVGDDAMKELNLILATSPEVMRHDPLPTFPHQVVSNMTYEVANSVKTWMMNRSPEFTSNVKLVKYSVDTVQVPVVPPTTAPEPEEHVEKPTDVEREFMTTGWVGGFWVEPEIRPLFNVAKKIVANGGYFNMLALGPSGYGKTSLYKALAEYLGYAFLRVDCAKITDTVAWFGTHEAKDGSTFFTPSDFTTAIEAGRVVVVLDEANRIEPWVQNSLFPLLDDSRRTTVHGREIVMGRGVVIGMTMNVGIKYAGTFVVDQAFMNRIDATVEVDAASSNIEEAILTSRYASLKKAVATQIVNMMRGLRDLARKESLDVDVSTRTSLKVARLMINGMTLSDALTYTVINSAAPEERKMVIDKIKLVK